MTKMSKELFIKVVSELVEQELGIKSEKIEFPRNNKTYTGLLLKTDDSTEINACPVANMDLLYDNYSAGMCNINDVLADVKMIIDTAKSQTNTVMNAARKVDFTNLDACKDKLFISVCGIVGNEEYLNNTVYRRIEDIAIVPRIYIDETNDQIMSSVIKKSFLKSCNMTEGELVDAAIANSAKMFPYVFKDTIDMLFDLMPGVPFSKDAMRSMGAYIESYVLTNNKKLYGASALFYPGVMYKIRKEIGDFLIFPSSVNETFIVPCRPGMDIDEYKNMVYSINRSDNIDADDVLTDSVYMYNGQFKRL